MDKLVLVVLFIYGIRGSSTQSLPCHTASGDNCPSSICPNTMVNYNCTISGTPGGLTDWTFPTGTCTNNTFSNRIRLSQSIDTFACAAIGPATCGPYSSVSSMPSSNPTHCLSSILTVKIMSSMDGSTVTCSNTNQMNSSITTIISSATINVTATPGSVGIMTVNNTFVDQLTVTWTPPTTGGVPTSYNITINDTISSQVSILASGPLQYTFMNLTNITLYTVSVVAINCAGFSNTSLTKWTLALPPDNKTIKVMSVFNPNNTLHHLEITWTSVGGAVTLYQVYLDGGIHGNTTCTTPQCFYVVPVSVSSTSYVISVASVNKDGYVGPKSTTTIDGTNNTIINNVTSMASFSVASNDVIATIRCSFLNNQSFYCVVCCSTDPSVPPNSSVSSSKSTDKQTELTVTLQGLAMDQMYYCKAAATNASSNNCAGPVVGDVKVFFIPFTPATPLPSTTPPPDPTDPDNTTVDVASIIGGVVGGVVGVGGAAGIVAIAVVVYKTTGGKGGSDNTDDTENLRVKKGKGTSPPPSDGTGGALYQDPKDIDHVKAPGGEMYAMADKPTRTYENAPKKPTATVTPADGGGALYQDPKDIQHTTQGGETYAVAEKKPAKPVDHTQAPTGDMYAVADTNKQPKKR